jgi:hypothetical protein
MCKDTTQRSKSSAFGTQQSQISLYIEEVLGAKSQFKDFILTLNLSFFTPVDVELLVLRHGNTVKEIQTI